jgi:hypothetical protein
MGGLAGLTTLAGFVVGGQDNVAARLPAMSLFSFMLMLGWVAVALLDLCYYNDLLYGAGEAITLRIPFGTQHGEAAVLMPLAIFGAPAS